MKTGQPRPGGAPRRPAVRHQPERGAPIDRWIVTNTVPRDRKARETKIVFVVARLGAGHSRITRDGVSKLFV